VPNLALTWQQAGVLAAVLLLGAAAGRRWARLSPAAPFIREAGIISALYALWQFAGTAPAIAASGAYSRARWIVRTEHDLHLPREADLQKLILPHPLLAQACNWYYATMHFAGLFALLLWLFVRHRDRYATVRTTIILLTVSCLLIQLVPVAPPRLLPGFVDVAAKYGQSVYTAFGNAGIDQLSAMPSVHVGWAVLVAGAVIWASPSRWRWWVLAHPIITVFVVVATANHFWLDGIVAIVLLGLAVLAQVAGHRILSRIRAPRPSARPPAAVGVGDYMP
jgi:hypothetical protein